ncbi:MAG: hypothetical protein AAF806_12115, partial [Bacteroidota bacterium]
LQKDFRPYGRKEHLVLLIFRSFLLSLQNVTIRKFLYSISPHKYTKDSKDYPVELLWEFLEFNETDRRKFFINASVGTFIPLTKKGVTPISYFLVEPQFRINSYYTIGVGIKSTTGFENDGIDYHYRIDATNLPYLGEDPSHLGEETNVFTASTFDHLASAYVVMERTFWKEKTGTFLGVGLDYFESFISNDIEDAIGYRDIGDGQSIIFEDGEGSFNFKEGILLHLRAGYSFSNFKMSLHFDLTTGETPEFFPF